MQIVYNAMSKNKKNSGSAEVSEFLDDQSYFDSDVTSNLDRNGIYLFSEEFTTSSVARCIKFILNKNYSPANRKPQHITLMFMSDGGDLSACFGLIDVMKGSRIPIHTVGIGSIASSALFAFMAGEPGHRTVTPNTSIMSHQFSWYTGGKAHELMAQTSELARLERRLINHIKTCTSLKTDADIRQYLLPPSDVYLEARDAIKLGIADRVATYYPYK